MNSELERLYEKLKRISYSDLYKVEADFCTYFYTKSESNSDPYINAFLIVSNWRATSVRSGVWTFYEATNQSDIEKAVEFLQQEYEELSAMIKKGIHDYQNPAYAESFEYPEEWIEESDEIDDWIEVHEEQIDKWLYDSLIVNEKLL